MFVMGLLLMACESQPAQNSSAAPAVVTVEVTRVQEQSVQVTQFATVQIPVEVTREIYIEVTPETTPIIEAEVGSAENPLQLIFSPVYGEQVTAVRAQDLATALSEATLYTFEAVLPTTYEEAIELACANATNSIAFLTALEYTLAASRCDLQIRFAGLRNGIAWQSPMLLVPADSEIETLEDLGGKSWGVRDADDFSVGLYYQALFEAQSIEVDATTEYETDTNTLLALVAERSEFVSADYLPPILPFNERLWEFGEDDPELWRATGQPPFRSGIGFIVVIGYVDDGGYHVRDARASVYDVERSIFNSTQILHVGDPLPNDAIGYGGALPLAIATDIDEILSSFMLSDNCATSLCSSDFFNWEGVEAVNDSAYDSVRFITTNLQLDEVEIFEYLNR